MKNTKEQIAKPRKVALYVHMEHEFYTINEVRFVDYDEHYTALPEGCWRELPYLDGYVRISEPVDVELREISNDEIMTKAVESLNETERKLMVETETKLAKIREQKRQLLALARIKDETNNGDQSCSAK